MSVQPIEPENIKFILCDLGRTLVDFDHLIVGQKLLKVIRNQHPDSRLTMLDLYQWFFQPDKTGHCRNIEVDKGAYTIADLGNDFEQEFRVRLQQGEFRKIWSEIFTTQHTHVITAMKKAQSKGIQVGICSSTNEAHWKYVKQHYPDIAKLTDIAFLTYELNEMKTEPNFFHLILSQTKLPANRHLFIDDIQSNLDCARSVGIHGLLYGGQLPDWTIFQ
ncbi:MAG: HAD family hydrolase [Sumerlaeia bacterium]